MSVKSQSDGAAWIVRRTTSIDTTWLEGPLGPRVVTAYGRDLRAEGGDLTVLDEARLDLDLAPDGVIRAVTGAGRLETAVGAFVGGNVRRGLRKQLREQMPDEVAGGSLTHLLLDDLPGAFLVAGWAWSRHSGDWGEKLKQALSGGRAASPGASAPLVATDVCMGLKAGSSALKRDGGTKDNFEMTLAVPVQPYPGRPDLLHPLQPQPELGHRRWRRIEVAAAGDKLRIESEFQDSIALRDQEDRLAIHHYRVDAVADAATLEIESFAVTPVTLPYNECFGAGDNLVRLHGVRLRELRSATPVQLAGPLGCTHLNDILRSFADIEALLERGAPQAA